MFVTFIQCIEMDNDGVFNKMFIDLTLILALY